FQHLAALRHPRDELVDELDVVPLQRDVQDRRGRKAGALARHQRRIARDDAGLFQRADPAPARRGRHAHGFGKLLVGGAAVLLQFGEDSFILIFNHSAAPVR
ncbi:hypothetical protein NS44R_14925, partial [Mammaliicoccus sciuri]